MLDGRAGEWTVSCSGSILHARVAALPDGRLSVLLSDGRQLTGRIAHRGRGEMDVSTSRGGIRLRISDPLRDRLEHTPAGADSSDADEQVRALMPGRVIEVAVASGDRIEAGTLLLVVEAMKMQNEIRAERAGLVGRIEVHAGEAIDGGAALLTVHSVKT